jgi:broad specificity phosphatase PhoE
MPTLPATPSLVILVRHAERAAEPGDDPGLSPAGARRAQALAQALADAHLEAIITTQFRRARETARPLAKRLEMEVEVVSARGQGLEAHVADVVAAVRKHDGPVLVVGHTNTLAGIAAGLGAPEMPDVCETTFGLAFVLAPRPTGGTSLLQLRYGDADPAPAPTCL